MYQNEWISGLPAPMLVASILWISSLIFSTESLIYTTLSQLSTEFRQKLTFTSITWFEIIAFKAWTKKTIGKKTIPKWDTTDDLYLDLYDNARQKARQKRQLWNWHLDMSFVYVFFLIYIS